MIGQVQTKDGQKIVEPISGSIPVGNPVGTLLSRANGQVPRNYLECDGSTFNEGQYPALYLHLGTNVLPERFDHTKLGDIESITVSTSSASQTTIEYDGFIFITTPYNTAFTIYINGTSFSSNVNAVANYCYALKKGDKIYTTAGCTCKIRYYKSHLYIKAVDGVDISDEDTFLVTVKNFVQEKNSYSTTEMLTGGKWIDGKPIYRKVFDNGSWASNLSINVSSLNIDTLVKSEVIGSSNSSGTQGKWVISNNSGVDSRSCFIDNDNVILLTRGSYYKRYVILEYTKTTD